MGDYAQLAPDIAASGIAEAEARAAVEDLKPAPAAPPSTKPVDKQHMQDLLRYFRLVGASYVPASEYAYGPFSLDQIAAMTGLHLDQVKALYVQFLALKADGKKETGLGEVEVVKPEGGEFDLGTPKKRKKNGSKK